MYSKKSVESTILSRSFALNERIMKIIVYGNTTGDRNHWMDGICEILEYVSRITIKPKAKKFKSSRYDDLLLRAFGSTLQDAENNLIGFHGEHSGEDYPEFEIDDKLAERLYSVYSDIRNIIPYILSSDIKYSSKYFKNILEKFI